GPGLLLDVGDLAMEPLVVGEVRVGLLPVDLAGVLGGGWRLLRPAVRAARHGVDAWVGHVRLVPEDAAAMRPAPRCRPPKATSRRFPIGLARVGPGMTT